MALDLNVLFWRCIELNCFGLASFVIGVILRMKYFYAADLLEDRLFVFEILMVLGFLACFAAAFGCFGSTIRHYPSLVYYSLLSLVMFVVGIIETTIYLLKYLKLESLVEDQLNGSMHKYYTNIANEKSWDLLQTELQCCGVNGSTDWKSFGNGSIPYSCCRGMLFDEPNKLFACTVDSIYEVGCFPLLFDQIEIQTVLLVSFMFSAIIFSVVQMFTIGYTCYTYYSGASTCKKYQII